MSNKAIKFREYNFNLNTKLLNQIFTIDDLLQYKIAEYSPKLYIKYMKFEVLSVISEENMSVLIGLIREMLAYEKLNYNDGNVDMLQSKLICYFEYLNDLLEYNPDLYNFCKIDECLINPKTKFLISEINIEKSTDKSLFIKYNSVLDLMNNIIVFTLLF